MHGCVTLQDVFGNDHSFTMANHLRLNKWEKAKVGDVIWVEQGQAAVVGRIHIAFHMVSPIGAEMVGVGIDLWHLLDTGPRYAHWRCTEKVQEGQAYTLLPLELRDALPKTGSRCQSQLFEGILGHMLDQNLATKEADNFQECSAYWNQTV
eukprot:4751070-Amphidinium_carterae.2